MKTKFILPILALGLFAACSDDNSTTTGPDPDPQGESTESSASVEPESSYATEPTSAAIEESSSSSSVEMAYKYYGAELTGVDQFKYGRFEARMKMVSFPGTVSSMFLNYDDSWMRKEKPWNEIDIEVIGKSATKWQSNILTREGDPDIGDLTATEKLHEITDVTENFHLFAIIWTP
jgi:beta-glucanase (GH16 family)